ncbi:hypothetical protein [Streptomyces sp. PT12]|uniref:hypothetical protein n=1 Tax=Streptomyces sp. PT12 TaxID=1510197 RepID=UPI000DE276A0|nr:hypothetical protein [Streptomyces sp. PT12]RBM23944.1 hypothetical protein DEH69_01295 [Streptomyces sp. PT12]
MSVDLGKVSGVARAASAANVPFRIGPGEARGAGPGVSSGDGKGHIFVKGEYVRGKVMRTIPGPRVVAALVAKALTRTGTAVATEPVALTEPPARTEHRQEAEAPS